MENKANGKIVLIADDDEALRRMYCAKLDREGFATLEAGDGEEALAAALKSHPDLILLDIRMPKLDGFAVMEKLRKDAWGQQVPIVIISNHDPNDEALREIDRENPSFYLLKRDYSLEDVIDKLKEVLNMYS